MPTTRSPAAAAVGPRRNDGLLRLLLCPDEAGIGQGRCDGNTMPGQRYVGRGDGFGGVGNRGSCGTKFFLLCLFLSLYIVDNRDNTSFLHIEQIHLHNAATISSYLRPTASLPHES